MTYSTIEIENAAETFGCDFITKKPSYQGTGNFAKLDFTFGQIAVINKTIPGEGTITVQKYKYAGNDRWEYIPQEQW